MSVSKAQILNFCSFLALDLENDTTISDYFDDIINRWSLIPDPPFQKATLVELSSGTGVYDYEADMLTPVYLVYIDKEIFPSSEHSLGAYSRDWRTESGIPKAYVTEELTRQYLLWPIPNANSGSTGGLSEPYGEDYPDDILFLLYSDDRSTAIQEIYQIPIALQTLSREFAYSSLQQDTDFSTVCNQVADFFMQILRR